MAKHSRKKKSVARRSKTRHAVHGGHDAFSEHPHMGGHKAKRKAKRSKTRSSARKKSRGGRRRVRRAAKRR